MKSFSQSKARQTWAVKEVQNGMHLMQKDLHIVKNDLHEMENNLTNKISNLEDTLQNIQALLKPKVNEILEEHRRIPHEETSNLYYLMRNNPLSFMVIIHPS